MNYCDFLFNVKEDWVDNKALVDVDSGNEFSFLDLQKSVLAISEKFNKMNISHGDVVLLHMVNSAEVVLAHLAVQYIGGITCLLDPLVPLNSLHYYLEDTKAKHLVSHTKIEKIIQPLENFIHSTEILPMIDSLPFSVNYNPYQFAEDDLSVIFYTSGTTSKPKGVMLAPKNYFNHVKIFLEGCYNYSSSDNLLCFVPFSHGYGSKSIFLPSLKTGATTYIMRSFHPLKVIEAIDKYNITHIFGVPSHFQQLLKREEYISTLKNLKAAFTAAALLKEETAKEWYSKVGIYLDEGYGLIETSTGVAFRLNRLPKILGDIGTYPIKLVEIETVDEKFNFLKSNERGEIVIRSESVMLGYLNKKCETDQAIVNGWFRTGDMGYKTIGNEVVLTGRIKDVINIAGIKVAPFEIESVINSHELVNESAVIGIENETYGEMVTAFVKLQPNKILKERELIKYLQGYLMNFQVPKRIFFKNDFPRNNMGKIDKKKLKSELTSEIT